MTQHTRSTRRALMPTAISALALGALMLSGCSATPVPSQDIKAFTLYAPVAETGDSPYQALADAFIAANPDYTITLETAATDVYGQGLTTKVFERRRHSPVA